MALTVFLLVLSNLFMTAAWYGHLRFKGGSLALIILVSWGIAFFEYCLQVPANRHGYASGLSAAELKTLQELITLVVFTAFAVLWLKEPLRWNVVAGFAVMAAGATLVFAPWQAAPAP